MECVESPQVIHLKRVVVGIICFIVLPAFSSCNNGSKDAIRDTPPPQVVSTSPTDNATDVHPDNSVSVAFSEEIDPSTLTTSTFRLEVDGKNVPGVVSSNGDSASFTPSGNLALLARYVATVTTYIQDMAGDRLASDYTWSFSTRDGSWAMAEQIGNSGNGEAIMPKVATGRNGDTVAVWKTIAHDHVWAVRYSDGGGWGTERVIDANTSGLSQVDQPQIAVDPNGNGIAIWRQSSSVGARIWANRYVAGSGWETARQIQDNVGSSTEPRIAMDPAGNAVAVWIQFDGSHRTLWTNRFDPAMGWGIPGILGSAGDSDYPAIAIDGSGNAIVVWEQSDGTRSDIMAIRYDAGSGWDSPQLIESENGNGGSPRIAMDVYGNAFVAWQQADGGLQRIYSNRYRAGSGWETAHMIENDAASNTYWPMISVDENGNAIVVYHATDNVQVHTWVNVYDSGAGWGIPRPLGPIAENTTRPQVVMDEYGNAVASWLQWDEILQGFNLWGNRYGRDAGWGTPRQLSPASSPVGYFPITRPEDPLHGVAITPQGTVVVVWLQYALDYAHWDGVWGILFH